MTNQAATPSGSPITQRGVSPKAFVGHYLWAVLAGVVIAVLSFLLPYPWQWLSVVGFLPPVLTFVWSWIARISTCYRLYPDRLEIETGILSRRIENIELFRVRDVGLRQGLYGRLADFGDVYIHSTDSTTPAIHVRNIDQPKEFYQQVRQAVTESRAQLRTMIVEEGASLPEP
jgi:membrane protein YdbS with pleckstrin-like domain